MKAALKQFCGAAAGSGGFDHATFSRLLGIYVSRDADGLNRVDYAAWKAAPTDLADLDGYIARLQAESPARLTRAIPSLPRAHPRQSTSSLLRRIIRYTLKPQTPPSA